jgi:acyl-homoserine-lactone acylase
MPYIGSGHNENTAWAMTTGGPDCTDVYELTLNTQDNEPTKYLYNKQWRDLKLRRYEINVKGIGQTAVRFFDSHLGPIAAIKDGKGYAIRSSYAKEVNALLPWHDFSFASSIDEIKKGLGALQLFPHNLMAADDSGNIYYQRTGRVPKRPEGYDWSKPVDGTTSDSEWLGIHPVSDLLQVTNPTQGYMQNCNVPPDAMMVNSPFELENTLSYIFADLTQSEALGYPTIDGWITSRGSRVVELLKNEKRTTIERVMAIANDIRPYSAHRWVESLIKANDYFRSNYEDNRSYNSAIKEMKSWNFELAANSKAALKYVYWRAQLRKNLGWAGMKKLSKKIDYLLEPLRETKTTVNLSRGELQLLASSFAEGLSKLETDLGTTDKTYGDVFRIARGNNSWPSEGGMAYSIGLTTVRSVHYGNTRPDNTRWAQGGQTSTTVVLLTKPVQSWTSVPFGQSNRSGSPHFSDQAEELFSKRKMKSSWWTFDELEKHIESVTTIEIPKDQ